MRYQTEDVLQIAKAIRDDAAGNKQATVTEMDLAGNMLESLARHRDHLRAAWQRAQVAPVVPEWNEAIADAGFEALDKLGFQVGQSDIGTDDLKTVFYAMLAASPTVKAGQVQCEFHGDDSSACEKYSGNVPCEPAPANPAERQDQGEVQRLRKDAKRYLWILNHYAELHGDRSLAAMALSSGGLDAAIDEAMTEKEVKDE